MDEAVEWPTCSTHYALVTEHDNLYEWVWESLGGPHAPIHFWMGGMMHPTAAFRLGVL